jgi:hypothetical protein
MALTLPLPEVPESRLLFGIGMTQASFFVIPGTSDYPTGGYIINTVACRLMRAIFSVSVDGGNSNTFGYTPSITIAYTLASNNIPNIPNSFAFQVEALNIGTNATQTNLVNLAAGVLTAPVGSVAKLSEIPNGTNLSGAIWCITVTGW